MAQIIYFLLSFLIWPNFGAAQLSEIFTNANDGAVLAGQATLTCQSEDCQAIQTKNAKGCETKDCRAIIAQNENWCLFWDCRVVIFAQRQGSIAKDLAGALCLSPNCIAIASQDPGKASSVDTSVMFQSAIATNLNYEFESVGTVVEMWKASVYYDLADLVHSFQSFYSNKAAQYAQELKELLTSVEVLTENPRIPLEHSRNRAAMNKSQKNCSIL